MLSALTMDKAPDILRVVALLCLCAFPARAQNLAIRNYTVSDGLAHASVISLHQDPKGYLWIATYEGLSRFDGYRFVNYGPHEGLSQSVINDVTSDRKGRLWVATNGLGVARLLEDPAERFVASSQSAARRSGKKFSVYSIQGDDREANSVNKILFDADNRLWCVTDKGLFRARQVEVQDSAFELVVPGRLPDFNNAALADSRGQLWFSVNEKVVRITNGQLKIYIPAQSVEPSLSLIPGSKDILSITEDERGRILAAEATCIYEFVEPALAGQNEAWQRWPLAIRYEKGIRAITPAIGGGLWIGTAHGLIHYREGVRKHYTTDNGLRTNRIRALLRDSENNLWIGTENSGLSKLAGDGVVSYTSAQGLPSREVYRLLEDREGNIYATVGCAPRTLVSTQEEVVTILQPPLPSARCLKSHLMRDSRGNTWYHTKSHLLQDSRGNWWFQTERGLGFALGPQLNLKSGRVLGLNEGFPEDFYTEMHQDKDGNVWVVNGITGNLYVTDSPNRQFPHLRFVTDGLRGAEFILRDSSGALWLASNDTIWRLVNGRLAELKASEGLPVIEPRAFFQDSKGHVWIGLRYHGVSMTAEPNAPQPRFINYRTTDGLSSDTVWAVAEDDQGRIYLGTGRGLDQLDIATRKIRRLTADDGVVGSVIEDLLKDRSGHLWVASDEGVTRIDPSALNPQPRPPSVYLSRISVAGEDLPLPETGAQVVAPLQLEPERNNIDIQFVGLSFRGENKLKYQYRLEGVDADWSMTSDQREVNYARLTHGHYRFTVRAVTDGGTTSVQPATFEFEILRPIYLRWWFVTLAALLLSSFVYALYRYRVRRLWEMAEMRTRIATDLHDDIGANLTRIALLSEVANQQFGAGGGQQTALLSSIAEIARESVASMSDIVWAINPERDSLLDLTSRVRRHAEEVFAMRDIELIFKAPDEGPKLKLGIAVRRDLLLIFKEAINNAARHSGCSQVKIEFGVVGAQLVMTIADDGRGFDRSRAHEGNGLRNMKRRAAALGGRLEIISGEGSGTTIEVRLPVGAMAD
jgi:ligand-binding sensor domain-containing protein/signal transduction histidine kinase